MWAKNRGEEAQGNKSEQPLDKAGCQRDAASAEGSQWENGCLGYLGSVARIKLSVLVRHTLLLFVLIYELLLGVCFMAT
jgi:hypothetical protein